MVQLSHPYKTTEKTIALTIWIFVGKVMSLFCNMLSRFFIAFLPRSKSLLISLLQSPLEEILEHKDHIAAAAAAKSLQSCPTLCDPMDFGPPGSSVHGIFQARVLEWGAIKVSLFINICVSI